MIRVYLLYAAFVILVTYLLFFHKKTVQFFKDKRAAKKQAENGETVVIDAKPAEQIFKEPEPDKQDGK